MKALVASPAAPGLWRQALRRLFAQRSAVIASALLAAVLLLCACAPLYASLVARSDPFRPNINGEVEIDGVKRAIIEASTEGLGLGQTPLGPTWQWGPYVLGADNQGRDVAARMLYGGRSSLLIATVATLLCLAGGALLGIVAGYFGGAVDWALSRVLDVLWAFPVNLLAISISVIAIGSGLVFGPLTIAADSLLLPAFIIGAIYVPYIARPVRAQVLGLRRSDFVAAAIGFGVPTRRILWVDVLPNVMPTLIVFVPLMMALNMLTESALSFLSIGVQAPQASWGTIIQDGLSLLYTRPAVALAPGVAIAVTVVALNLLGDALRDALDPRAVLRVNADDKAGNSAGDSPGESPGGSPGAGGAAA